MRWHSKGISNLLILFSVFLGILLTSGGIFTYEKYFKGDYVLPTVQEITKTDIKSIGDKSVSGVSEYDKLKNSFKTSLKEPVKKVFSNDFLSMGIDGDLAELHLYDDKNPSNHTGPITNPRDNHDYEKKVPASAYDLIESSVNIGFPLPSTDSKYIVDIKGKKIGLAEFWIGSSDDFLTSYFPISINSKGFFTVENIGGDIHVNKIQYDIDGDGTVDYQISHKDGVSSQESLDMLSKIVDKIVTNIKDKTYLSSKIGETKGLITSGDRKIMSDKSKSIYAESKEKLGNIKSVTEVLSAILYLESVDFLNSRNSLTSTNVPADTPNETKDSQRINDIMALNTSIALFLAITDENLSCIDGKLYRSIEGTTAVDGTGWLPIDFTKIQSGSPISRLPIDPDHDAGRYYAYACDPTNNKYELSSLLESGEYKTRVETDGGNNPSAYEVGDDPGLDLIK